MCGKRQTHNTLLPRDGETHFSTFEKRDKITNLLGRAQGYIISEVSRLRM